MSVKPGHNIQCLLAVFILFHIFIFIFVSILQFKRIGHLRDEYTAENTRMLQLQNDCKRSEINTDATIQELEDVLEGIIPGIDLGVRSGIMDLSKRQTLSIETLFQELLNAQLNILEQHCINNTRLCVRGINGANGDSGTKGEPGEKGQMGDKGNQGPVGLIGSQGDVGQKGIMGIQGLKGMPGNIGQSGPVGQKGEVGLPGIAGEKGDRGLIGQKGSKGIKGLPGQAGIAGEKGEPGEKGQKGEQGLQGPSGEKGEPGIPGPSGVITDSDCVCIEDKSGKVMTSPAPTNNVRVTTSLLPGNISKHMTYNVTVGRRASLHCDNKSSVVTWSMVGQSLNDRVVTSGADLVIPEVYKVDNGTYKCVTQTTGGKTSTQSFTLNVKDGSTYDCDFEVDLCRWTQIKYPGDQLDWTRTSYGTSSSQTGPSNDHTYGSHKRGYYIYLESTQGLSGYRADIVSTYFSTHHTYCLDFWYHMYGASVNELAVFSKSSGTSRKIWSMKGNQGNQWHHGNVTLLPALQNYQIIFRAVKGYSHTGDIGLDDIIVMDGSC